MSHPDRTEDFLAQGFDRRADEHLHVHCECGEWSGEACNWRGPRADTVIVEFMPEHLRASHEAAGGGDRGVYPHNGAVRIRCERSCAARIIEADGKWAETRD